MVKPDKKVVILVYAICITLCLVMLYQIQNSDDKIIDNDSYKLQKEKGVVYSEKQLLIGNTGNPIFTDEEYLIIMRSNK